MDADIVQRSPDLGESRPKRSSLFKFFCGILNSLKHKPSLSQDVPSVLQLGLSNDTSTEENRSERLRELSVSGENPPTETELHNNLELMQLQHPTLAASNRLHDLKTKLAQNEETIRSELKALQRLRKRSKIEKKLEKIWQEVDRSSKTNEQLADSLKEKHITEIGFLKREVKLLKEKQNCKLLEYEILHNKGYNGIVSETLWQCKVLKLKYQYYTLGRAISRLHKKIQFLECNLARLSFNKKRVPCTSKRGSEDLNKNQGDNNDSSIDCDGHQCRPLTPPLYPGTPEFPLHLLLPKKLYSIEEETMQEMVEYEAGLEVDPHVKSRDYSPEYILPNGHTGWMDFLNLDEVED